MILTCLIIPFELPAPNYVNNTAAESKFNKPKAEVGSILTTVP
jgi:hypothetical protein